MYKAPFPAGASDIELNVIEKQRHETAMPLYPLGEN